MKVEMETGGVASSADKPQARPCSFFKTVGELEKRIRECEQFQCAHARCNLAFKVTTLQSLSRIHCDTCHKIMVYCSLQCQLRHHLDHQAPCEQASRSNDLKV